jgi:transcriptional repressor NrdR
MDCPKCRKDNTGVVDSRDVDGETVRRRRECLDCKYRFTTYERVEPIKISVIKRSGTVEPFEREKIRKGIAIASGGRIKDELIDSIVDEVEHKIILSKASEVSSKKIGKLVISRLKKIDEVTYLRFTSVYKKFDDLSSFEEELIQLKK